MEFDEQLGRAFDQLAVRLREEIAGHLNAAVAELSASVDSDRARAVTEATRQAWTVAERDVSERLAGSLAAAEARARADFEANAVAATERLLDAIRALDRAQSLSDILDALVLSACNEASRAAIVLPEGSHLRGWRFIGFDASLTQTAGIQLSFEEAGIMADAAETGRVVRAGAPAWSRSSVSSAPRFAELPPDRPALAVPLVMSGQVFAVLYADQGSSGDIARDSWPATIEVLARHAARSLEAVTVGRLAQVVVSR